MPMCAVKNLIKMLWTIPSIDKNEKNIFVHSTHTPRCVELTFTGSRSSSC